MCVSGIFPSLHHMAGAWSTSNPSLCRGFSSGMGRWFPCLVASRKATVGYIESVMPAVHTCLSRRWNVLACVRCAGRLALVTRRVARADWCPPGIWWLRRVGRCRDAVNYTTSWASCGHSIFPSYFPSRRGRGQWRHPLGDEMRLGAVPSRRVRPFRHASGVALLTQLKAARGKSCARRVIHGEVGGALRGIEGIECAQAR